MLDRNTEYGSYVKDYDPTKVTTKRRKDRFY